MRLQKLKRRRKNFTFGVISVTLRLNGLLRGVIHAVRVFVKNMENRSTETTSATTA